MSLAVLPGFVGSVVKGLTEGLDRFGPSTRQRLVCPADRERNVGPAGGVVPAPCRP